MVLPVWAHFQNWPDGLLLKIKRKHWKKLAASNRISKGEFSGKAEETWINCQA